MSFDNLSCVSQNVLKFYQQLTGEERRLPFIFDDFHFCRSRVIGLDMMENKIFTLCRMITWVVFFRIFWNLSSSLLMKREGSLSFLMIFTFIVPELEALYFMQCHRQILVMSELQIKKNSCQTLDPASKRVLPDLSTFCQTYIFF